MVDKIEFCLDFDFTVFGDSDNSSSGSVTDVLRSRLIEWFGCTPDANKGY